MKSRFLFIAIPFHLLVLGMWLRSAFISDFFEFMPVPASSMIMAASSHGNFALSVLSGNLKDHFDAVGAGPSLDSQSHPFQPFEWFSPIVWQSGSIREAGIMLPYWSLLIAFWLPSVWRLCRKPRPLVKEKAPS